MSDVVDSVRDLAYVGHDGQYRRGPGHVPYIEHPKAVVETLKGWGVTDEAILAAAWAHDLLEDTELTEEEIANAGGKRLGPRIIAYVTDLTYSPELDGSKKEWLDHMAEMCSPEVLLIKAADRYCNTCDFCAAGKFAKAKDYLLDAWILIEKVCHSCTRAKADFAELLNKIQDHI